MLDWIYYLNTENPPADYVHEKAQNTCYLSVINMKFAKERETNIIVKLSGTPGLMAEDTSIEQGLQNPEIKEVTCNTYSKAKWDKLL